MRGYFATSRAALGAREPSGSQPGWGGATTGAARSDRDRYPHFGLATGSRAGVALGDGREVHLAEWGHTRDRTTYALSEPMPSRSPRHARESREFSSSVNEPPRGRPMATTTPVSTTDVRTKTAKANFDRIGSRLERIGLTFAIGVWRQRGILLIFSYSDRV